VSFDGSEEVSGGLHFLLFSFKVMKLLKFIRVRLSFFKFRLPKFFKLHQNQTKSYEASSSDGDSPSASPVLHDTKTKHEIKPTAFNRYNSKDDREMTAIYRATQPTVTSTRSSTPMSLSRSMTPAIFSKSQQREHSATPFMNQQDRDQCQAKTVKGFQCKNAALAGSSNCQMHKKE
jgi:hypothetical protein